MRACLKTNVVGPRSDDSPAHPPRASTDARRTTALATSSPEQQRMTRVLYVCHCRRLWQGGPAMHTGDAYVASLRDGRAVFLDGERVKDVTDHPAFAEPI